MTIQAIDGVLQQLQTASLQASNKSSETSNQVDFGATMKAALDKISETQTSARAQAQERAAAHGQERTQGASSENLDERSAHTDSPQQPAWAPSVRALPAGSTAERKVLVWKRARD